MNDERIMADEIGRLRKYIALAQQHLREQRPNHAMARLIDALETTVCGVTADGVALREHGHGPGDCCCGREPK